MIDDDVAAVERARELLEELDSDEAPSWMAWAWETYRVDAPPLVVDAARDVARRLEAAHHALRRFVAEHELAAARLERDMPMHPLGRAAAADASAFGDEVDAGGCGLYPAEDARDD
jgi:hypothetical protein